MKNIPFVPGMYQGIGCNILTGRLFDSPFQQVDLYSPSGEMGQTVEFGLNTITSSRDLSKKLSFDASMSLNAVEMFSTASATARLLKNFTVSAHHLYLLVSVVVTHSHEILTTFSLKPEVSLLLEDKTLDQFRASYGNGFIAGFIRGGCYYGLIEIQTDSLEEKLELAGKIDAQSFAAGGAKLDAERYLTEAIADKKTQISIFRSGGLSESAGVTLEQMLSEASTFPDSVAKNPSITFAIYRDYDEIPPFSQLSYSLLQEHKKYIQCIEYLENLYLQYRDYKNTLETLISSSAGVALLSSSTTNEIKSVMEIDLAGISTQMETIESLIHDCNENRTLCETPITLYQLSTETKNLLNSWSAASEEPNRIEPSSEPTKSNENMVNRLHYNAAIVGITGVGKSTLLNYLFGEQVAATGVGRPVTQRGFHSYDFTINDLPVKLFDSWGLEIDMVDEWMKSLDEELSLRGTDRPAEEWFHTILYCISAAGRVQGRDSKIIKRFLDSKYQVIVILTKAETLTEEEKAEFAQEIRLECAHENIPIIPACSVSKKVSQSLIINPFGKEEIESQIYDNFWDTIITRLPQRCRRVVEDYLDEWENSQIKLIQKQAEAKKSLDDIKKQLDESWDDTAIERLVQEEIKRTMYVYGQIVETIELNAEKQTPSPENGDKKYSTLDLKSISKSIVGAAGAAGAAEAALAGAVGAAAAGFTGFTASGISILGALALSPVGMVLTPIAVAIPIMMWRKRVDRSKAIDALIETVKTETKKLREGLDELEKAIEQSLENMRNLTSNRD